MLFQKASDLMKVWLGLSRSWHTTEHKLKFWLHCNSICTCFEEVSRKFKGVQHAGLSGSCLKETEASCYRCNLVLTFAVLSLDSHWKPHPTYSACNGVQPLTTNALWLGYSSLCTIWNSLVPLKLVKNTWFMFHVTLVIASLWLWTVLVLFSLEIIINAWKEYFSYLKISHST